MAQCRKFLFLVCWGSSIGHAQGKAASAFLENCPNCPKLSCFGFLWAMEAANRKWKKLGSKWKDMFPLDPGQPSLGSWLDEQDDPWGIGCRACRSAGCAGNLAQYLVATDCGLQKQNFAKHAQSNSHRASVRQYLSVAVSATAGSSPVSLAASAKVSPDSAPSLEKFRDCFHLLRDGKALDGRKNAAFAFCLSEAMKSIDQRRLPKSSEIGLFRDERKGRILVRFRAVTDELDVWCGMLGQERDAGTGGENLTLATEKILKRSCSRWAGSGSDKQKPFVKTKLLEHVRNNITTLTVDSAGDELLSGELMRTAFSPEQKVLCPNLRNVIRDKVRSSRRLTSRLTQMRNVPKQFVSSVVGKDLLPE